MEVLLPLGVTGFRVSPAELRTAEPLADRLAVKTSRADWLATPGMHEMWATAAKTGQAICGLINEPDLDGWEQLVRQYPRTRVVVDHFCRIGTDGNIVS